MGFRSNKARVSASGGRLSKVLRARQNQRLAKVLLAHCSTSISLPLNQKSRTKQVIFPGFWHSFVVILHKIFIRFWAYFVIYTQCTIYIAPLAPFLMFMLFRQPQYPLLFAGRQGAVYGHRLSANAHRNRGRGENQLPVLTLLLRNRFGAQAQLIRALAAEVGSCSLRLQVPCFSLITYAGPPIPSGCRCSMRISPQ